MNTKKKIEKVSKKRKFVADGIFRSEVAEFLEKMLSDDGYGGVDVRVTPARTDIVIKSTTPKKVIGEKGKRIQAQERKKSRQIR